MGPLAWAGVCCGTVGGLAIVLVLTGAAAGPGSAAGSSSATSLSSRQAPAAQVAAARRVGQDGDFAFRFTGITCGFAATLAVYGDPDLTGPQPVATTECLIRLRVTDDKGQAQTFFDSDQYAYDARGRQFFADVNSAYLTGDMDDTQLKPGVSMTALVPFNMPAGDSITRLELHESAFSRGVTFWLQAPRRAPRS